MATYVAKIVERNGSFVRDLVDANIQTIRHGINDTLPEATVTYPKYDPPGATGQGADVQLLSRELKILRDGSVIHRGPMTKRKSGSRQGDRTITVPGAAWYFGKRFIDTHQHNLVLNWSFDDGTLDWAATACTMTAISTPAWRGVAAMRLVGTDTFGDQFIEQTVTVTGGPAGSKVTAAAWYYLESWTGPAVNSRGLYIDAVAGVTVETFNDRDGTIDDAAGASLDTWTRLVADTWVPPGATRNIRIRLYAPHGSIVWDDVLLVERQSLAIAAGTPEDIATTANRIVTFAQDGAFGKDDLYITTTTPPASSITFQYPKEWPFADHTPVDRALNDEIMALGVDWDVDPNKQFNVYWPNKGTDRSATVTLTLGGNVADYEFDENGDETENDITFYGDGSAEDREEGFAIDTTDLGYNLEGRYSMPPGGDTDNIDLLALNRMERGKVAPRVVTVTMIDGSLIGTVDIGDLVTLAVADGTVALSGVWRIISWELTPRTDTLKLTLNPR